MGVSEERLVKRRKKLLSLRSSGFGWPMYGNFGGDGIGQTAQGAGHIDDHDGDDNDTPLGPQFAGGSAPAPAGGSGDSGGNAGGGTT